MICEILEKLSEKKNLTQEEAYYVFNSIMSGELTNSQMAGVLVALKLKGETTDELAGAAKSMREKSTKIELKKDIIVDTCGTGGDRKNYFNISTLCAIVVSACGLTVAKHGNRSVSSKSGSADIMESLGVKIDCSPSVTKKSLAEIGIGFLFAPLYHPAMKFAAPVRKELGIRTIFNLLGPLTNPCSANIQLLGVYDRELTETLANVLNILGSKRAFVVSGVDNSDEITLTDKTRISFLNGGKVTTFNVEPEYFGFSKIDEKELKVSSTEENKKEILDILDGKKGPKRDIVVLNSAAAVAIAKDDKTIDPVMSIKNYIKQAEDAIDSKKAKQKLQLLKEITNKEL